MSQLDPIVNLPLLYVNNLKVNVASNTTITVDVGQARDSNNVMDIVVGSLLTINAAVNGVNGLDVGTFDASTWYYVMVIADSSGKNPVGSMLSLSRTAPTLPFGYDSFRSIDAQRTDGSVHFLVSYNTGTGSARSKFYDTMISVLTSGTASVLTTIDLAGAVPPIDRTPVYIEAAFTPATANDKVSFAVPGSTATVLPSISGVVAAKIQTGQLKVLSLLSTTQRIQYINSAASGNTDVYVYGFDYYI